MTLSIVEVSRNCDNSLGDCCSEIVFSGLLHLLENHCADLLWSILTAVNLDTWLVVVTYNLVRNTSNLAGALLHVTAHETLDRIDCTCWVCYSLTLSRLTNLTLATIDETYD